MAMFSSARHAVRRSLATSLGVGLRQATEEPSSRRLLQGQLLPRLFGSDASASNETSPGIDKHFAPSGSEVDADLEMEYKRLHEERRKELIRLLVKAVDTCEPAHRDRVMVTHEEVQRVRQEYLTETQLNGQKTHNTYNGATGPSNLLE